MISSRWPRPTFVIESIDLMPVCERLLHRLALDDARRLELERRVSVASIGPLAVERIAERVDDAAEQRLAHGDARDACRCGARARPP